MLAVLAGTQVMFWKIEHREFQQSLPVEVRAELDDLTARGLEDGPRAMQIYGEYWAVDPMRGEKLALLFTVLLGLPLGLASGFFISKVITLPLDSMAAAATGGAGDFTVRAHVGKARGEMAEMVRDFNHMIDSLETLDREQRVTLASISRAAPPIAVLSARCTTRSATASSRSATRKCAACWTSPCTWAAWSRTCCRWLRSAGCRCGPAWIWWRWSATR